MTTTVKDVEKTFLFSFNNQFNVSRQTGACKEESKNSQITKTKKNENTGVSEEMKDAHSRGVEEAGNRKQSDSKATCHY